MRAKSGTIGENYFGFKRDSNRAKVSWLYARSEGATEDEVNEFAKDLGKTVDYYNMLEQATKWGHEVVTWYDPDRRGKVFKLKYNPDHTAKRAGDPPTDWEDMNSCDHPEGLEPVTWLRTHRSK